ncbi:MAG: hypothetical protein K8R25_02975, partial [Methanosarcinales archaeon]|nr:hypothetical protein [Methanosarcinales archaeon]
MVVKNKLKLNLLILITLTILIICIQPVLAEPLITIDNVSSPTNIDFQIVSGTMSSGATVFIYCEFATVSIVTQADNIWSANISGMKEPGHLITAVAIDSVHIRNSTTAAIILDTTPPEIEIN